jgi:hypothetical protein
MSVTLPDSSGRVQQDSLEQDVHTNGECLQDDSEDDDPVLNHQRGQEILADDPLAQTEEEP